ncbi:hypothetical protein OROGR_001401 [Orobanche gracilis]
MDPELGFAENSFDLRYTRRVGEALNELPDCFTITDPCISGHPIVFASNGFLKMVGYSKDEVVGKNGRIFQGPETDRRSVMEIREAIREAKTVQLSLLNYRKDGKPFWMLFQLCPVFSKEDGRVINFVGVQVPILRKIRMSGYGMSFCEDAGGNGDVVLRYCRREVCLELSRLSSPDSVSSDHDRGRIVCRKRHCLTGNGLLLASLNISLGRIRQSFVLTDALLPDMSIVYASEAFLKLTGYAMNEVLGQNCRLLSGIDTDPATKVQIKDCVRRHQACTVRILNYRKDRTPFWNFLHISPVRNASGTVAFFVGIQMEDQCNNRDTRALKPEMRQLSVVGAVKVALRGLTMEAN